VTAGAPGWARALWVRIETIHAVTYFAPGSREAAANAGLKGFWMGYFGFRAAPLGAVGAAAVEATFFNFAPGMVRRSIPDAWRYASPDELVATRAEAAADALRAVSPDVERVAGAASSSLERAVDEGSASGRPLFAANRAVPLPADPVAAVWQHCTTLREHRGDGHVASLLVADLDGCEAHVLFAADRDVPIEVLRDNRGWSADEWAAATARLVERGLLRREGGITDAGLETREHVETETDRLAAAPFAEIDAASMLELLDPLARAIVEARVIPFPNPMGLPSVHAPTDGPA
jgi:hypothetical protein